MPIIRSYLNSTPVLGKQVFVAEGAAIIGDVVIGDRSSIWYSAVIRGDMMPIRIGEEVSIQDGAVVHVTTDKAATNLGSRITVGHRAILHGCTVDDDVLIGMGAIVMDGAHVHSGCIVGAGALVTPGTVIPPGHLAVGSPARAKRPLNDAERRQIAYSAAHYVEVAASYLAAARSDG